MATGSRDGRRLASAWALSVAAHAALVGAGARARRALARRPGGRASPRPRPRPPRPAPRSSSTCPSCRTARSSGATADPARPAVRLPRGGGEAPAPRHGRERPRRHRPADLPAVNLADRDDATLSVPRGPLAPRQEPDPARPPRPTSRASREDWRASREPMELTFLAGGGAGASGPERRTPRRARPLRSAPRDGGAPQRRRRPARRCGRSPQAPTARRRARRAGATLLASAATAPHAAGGPVEGGERASAGLGVRDGRPGDDHRRQPRRSRWRGRWSPRARPPSPPSVAGRTRTTRWTASRRWPRRSSRSSTPAPPEGRAGSGLGGQVRHRPRPARAAWQGPGCAFERARFRARRPARQRPARPQAQPLRAAGHGQAPPAVGRARFPKWAAAEGLPGHRDRDLRDPRGRHRSGSASVTRPSGIPEFDENCRARGAPRGSPYPPVPARARRELPAGRCRSTRRTPPSCRRARASSAKRRARRGRIFWDDGEGGEGNGGFRASPRAPRLRRSLPTRPGTSLALLDSL